MWHYLVWQVRTVLDSIAKIPYTLAKKYQPLPLHVAFHRLPFVSCSVYSKPTVNYMPN